MTIRHVEERDITEIDQLTANVGAEEPGDDITGNDEVPPSDDVVSKRRGWLRRAMSHWALIVTGLLLVAAAAGTAELYFGQYRGDQHTNDAAATKSAIGAASDGTVALLSYAPDKLESDLAAAKSHLTGDFLTYYTNFTDQILSRTAKEKAVNTKATVKRAAIAELHAESARVLVFVDQTTMSKDAPEPVQAASSVMVTLTKVYGAWLISAFDPI
jgi:Mce-associated membrane protein